MSTWSVTLPLLHTMLYSAKLATRLGASTRAMSVRLWLVWLDRNELVKCGSWLGFTMLLRLTNWESHSRSKRNTTQATDKFDQYHHTLSSRTGINGETCAARKFREGNSQVVQRDPEEQPNCDDSYVQVGIQCC